MKRILNLITVAILITICWSCQEETDMGTDPSAIIPEALSCPSSHPYQCGGNCYTDAAQAASAGCTSVGGGTSGGNNGGSSGVGSVNCSSSHPYECGGNCYTDATQASSAGCNSGSNSGGNDGSNSGGNNGGGSNVGTSSTCDNGSNWDPNNTVCVRDITGGNGNPAAGCINSDGFFVSGQGVVSNPCNSKLAIRDIEINLGIDIDDSFYAASDYQDIVPAMNPSISKSEFIVYMKALFVGINVNGKTGDQFAVEFANLLDTNNDGILFRTEASQAKGADPRQVLNLEPIFGIDGGLATDDVLAYVGLYLGDGAIDKYAGDLPQVVQDNMAAFTRTWQPGVTGTAARYLNLK